MQRESMLHVSSGEVIDQRKKDSYVQQTGLNLVIHNLQKWHWFVIPIVIVDVHGMVVTITQVHRWVCWLFANGPELAVEDTMMSRAVVSTAMLRCQQRG
jgi:hypothetical protein